MSSVMSRRAVAIVSSVLFLSAVALVWSSTHVWWVRITPRTDPLPPVTEEMYGRDVAGWLPAVGFVVGAAVMVLWGVSARWVAVISMVVSLSGAGVVFFAVSVLWRMSTQTQWENVAVLWPSVALVCGVSMLCVGAWVVSVAVRRRAPRGVREVRREKSVDLWRALEEGEDPTAEPENVAEHHAR